MKKKNQNGFSLIEVLIALVILSVGLLGLAGLQTSSLRTSDSAYLRTKANMLAYNLLDRMRANIGAAKSGAYDQAMTGTIPGANKDCASSGVDCSHSELADWDMKQWMTLVTKPQYGLPGGEASVKTVTSGANNGNKQVTVQVQWLQRGVGQDKSNESASISVSTAF